MTTLQYMAISGLAYVDLDSLTDSNNDPWTIESLAKAGKIIGFAINPDTDEITVSKPELASLSSMLDWTIVNAQQNTSTGFAGIAVQAPSDGEIIFGLRGTEPPESGVDRLLNDMLTDAQLAVQGATRLKTSKQPEVTPLQAHRLNYLSKQWRPTRVIIAAFRGSMLSTPIHKMFRIFSINIGQLQVHKTAEINNKRDPYGSRLKLSHLAGHQERL